MTAALVETARAVGYLIERGPVCERAASPPLTAHSASYQRGLSLLSLYAVLWMEAGWRVYSATLESAGLVQTCPTTSRRCRARRSRICQSRRAFLRPYHVRPIAWRCRCGLDRPLNRTSSDRVRRHGLFPVDSVRDGGNKLYRAHAPWPARAEDRSRWSQTSLRNST